MYVRVEEVMGRDEWQSQHGPMVGWNLRVTDENGGEDFISLNAKPNNTYTIGQEFNFIPNGQFFGAFKKGKRENQTQGGGQRTSAPAASPQRAGNAPQTPSRNALELPRDRYFGAKAKMFAEALTANLAAIEKAGLSITPDAMGAVYEQAGKDANMAAMDMGLRCLPQDSTQLAAKAAEGAKAAEEAARKAAEEAAERAKALAQATIQGYQPGEAAATDDPDLPF